MLEKCDAGKLVEPLQDWFDSHARLLPWRQEPGAYEVWVSEIMLQQTRVETVKPYFIRFMEALPDIQALADCPEDRYLKLWEGLGYYNRVKNLHTAAQQVIAQYAGVVPDSPEELRKLKGVGSYTAGAIASIAYNQPVPAVDGNVLRVLTRVCADESDIARQSVRTAVEQELGVWMPQQSGLIPRKFNQALMELGALVCVPNGAPHCADCPWEALCEAKKQGKTDVLPVKTKAKQRRVEKKTVFLIRDSDRVALRKRPEKGLLAGLYELPNCPGHLAREKALSYVKKLGFRPIRIRPLAGAKHIFSHVEWHMQAYQVLVEEPEPEEGGLLFVEIQRAVQAYAVPGAFSFYWDAFRQEYAQEPEEFMV